MVYPSSSDPKPSGVSGDIRLRRALYHAIDRQEMASDPTRVRSRRPQLRSRGLAEYRAVESSLVKYEYDPRRGCSQLLEELGYTCVVRTGRRVTPPASP